jgi:hypothetical protein
MKVHVASHVAYGIWTWVKAHCTSIIPTYLPQSTEFEVKLVFAHLVKKVQFFKIQNSLLCSQEPTTGSCADTYQYNPYSHIQILWDLF